MDGEQTQGGEAELRVEHFEGRGRGDFHVERDGRRVAELTYARRSPALVTLDHTFVDESLRGSGVARKLVGAAVDWARATGTKLDATCPYARSVLERDPSLADVRP